MHLRNRAHIQTRIGKTDTFRCRNQKNNFSCEISKYYEISYFRYNNIIISDLDDICVYIASGKKLSSR